MNETAAAKRIPGTMRTQRAMLRFLHIAPRKVRLITGTIQGLSVSEAEAQLLHRPQRAAQPLLKLLRSAVADAKQTKQLEARQLRIASIRVDQGPMLKRSLPRAQGRATPIQKKMSHVVLVLMEIPAPAPARFTIIPPKKEKKPEKGGKKIKKEPTAPELKEQQKETAVRSPGFMRRIFRRKSI